MKNKNQKRIVIGILASMLAVFLVQCGSKGFRSKNILIQPTNSAVDKLDQVTKLKDVIEESSARDREILKRIVIEETFEKVVTKSLSVAKVSDEAIKESFDMMLELGVAPEDKKDQVTQAANGDIYVNSGKALNGLRYFRAGFRLDEDLKPKESFYYFEMEPFKGNFDFAVKLLKKHYPNLGEPCYDSALNQIFFRDGDYLIQVSEETEDTIDLASVYPPRTMEDVGSVAIIMDSDPHVEVCGFKHEH